ncbi:MAG: hypothetical protein ACRESZ_12685 [Methylococcales bacterium]
MLAEKFILHTDNQGRLTGLPNLAPNEEVEVIVLRKEPGAAFPRHKPSPKLAYQGAKLLGDDLAPAIALEEWGDLFRNNDSARP